MGVVVSMACLWAASAFALDPMGPPRAGLKKGQFEVGLEYSFSEMDLRHGLSPFIFPDREYEIEDMHRVYVNVGYGVTDWFEAFLRVGGATMEFSEPGLLPGSPTWGGDGDFDFAFGGGAKLTFCKVDRFTFGGIAQFSWTEIEGDYEADPNPGFPDPSWWDGDFETEITLIQFALGVTWEPTDILSLYGGLFHFSVIGEHYYGPASPIGIVFPDESSLDEPSDTPFGGYMGVQAEFFGNAVFNIEGMAASRAWAVSAGFGWRF